MNGRSIACLALVALIPLSEAQAQESVPVGTRVRVTAPDIAKKPISGTVASTESGVLTLVVPGDEADSERTIPVASMTRLEIYRGRSHSPLKGMGTGLLVGAGIGLGIGVGAATENDPWVCQGAGCVLAGTLGGAVWGTVIGGLFGAAIGHDRWADALVLRPVVAIGPGDRGFSLAVSLSL